MGSHGADNFNPNHHNSGSGNDLDDSVDDDLRYRPDSRTDSSTASSSFSHPRPFRLRLVTLQAQDQDQDHLAVVDRIPGLRTTTAFFNSLRANLRLHDVDDDDDDFFPSNLPTPDSAMSPPQPSSSTLAAASKDDASKDPLASVPPLTTSLATSSQDFTSALKLVADSVAQQRQLASLAIIYSPLTLSLYVLLLAVISQYFYRARSDLPLIFTTAAGVTMACLLAVRAVSSKYLLLAEGVGVGWLTTGEADGQGQSDILVTKFGDEIIAALVIRLPPSTSTPSTKKKSKKPTQSSSSSSSPALIRAWTTRLRYRHKGVGRALLVDGVKHARTKAGDPSLRVAFDEDHANARLLLPPVFNQPFRRREDKAREMLRAVVAGVDG